MGEMRAPRYNPGPSSLDGDPRMHLLAFVLTVLRPWLQSRAALALENLALRQQLAVLRRSVKRPYVRDRNRIFWVWLSRFWSGWASTLVIVKPETVIRWHRTGFRLYWRRRSRRRTVGRPKVEVEIRNLIRRMCLENPTWGAPRIRSELRLLGYDVSVSTVAKYMIRPRKPPSQTWRTFLENHVGEIAAIDFFTVPTATFRILFCFLVLFHHRRRVVNFNVTADPLGPWAAQQVIEAFPFDEAPRFLLRDRDSVYEERFRRRIRGMGITEVVIAPHAPWQNPYVERIIGSIRRDCLDHVIIHGESHLRKILSRYFAYYHEDRVHMSLERNAPNVRAVEPRGTGKVISEPRVGGLHHRYRRVA
jgi:putative transposase